MNYKTLLQEQISYKSLKKASLSYEDDFIIDKEIKISYSNWKENWELNEPLLGIDNYNVFTRIGEDFIQSRIAKNKLEKFSMLIYGPPGTGKTSLAKSLAQSLNWKLITITPSDFIKYGESGIEERAKCIFKTLEEQKDCVVLFDEIDRLILDRNSKFYAGQSDMFQFMTPSMLVKFKDLYSKKNIIFIIATNYEERLDPAIKRQGRIDAKYLICPPNKNQRQKIIDRLIRKYEITDFNENQIEEVSKKTCLFTYGELKLLIETTKKKINPKLDATEYMSVINSELENQYGPSIKLNSYIRRLPTNGTNISKEEIGSIFPFEEFFLLVFLLCEIDHIFSKEEKKIISQTLKLVDIKTLDSYVKSNDVINVIREKFHK